MACELYLKLLEKRKGGRSPWPGLHPAEPCCAHRNGIHTELLLGTYTIVPSVVEYYTAIKRSSDDLCVQIGDNPQNLLVENSVDYGSYPGLLSCNKCRGRNIHCYLLSCAYRNIEKSIQEIDENGYPAVNLSVSVGFLNHVSAFLIPTNKKLTSEKRKSENGEKKDWKQCVETPH